MVDFSKHKHGDVVVVHCCDECARKAGVNPKRPADSDKGGSGNTANIGSINNIADIVAGRGMFSKLGEHWFDEYWMNYKKITVQDGNGGTKKISTLREFVEYKNWDVSLIVEKRNGEE